MHIKYLIYVIKRVDFKKAKPRPHFPKNFKNENFIIWAKFLKFIVNFVKSNLSC